MAKWDPDKKPQRGTPESWLEGKGKKSEKTPKSPDEEANELTDSFKQLAELMHKAGQGELVLNPKGSMGLTEKRALRFAYCVLGWSPLKISKAMGRNYATVCRAVANGRFTDLRRRVDANIIKGAVKRLEGQVEEVTALTVTCIRRWLMDSIKQEAPLTAKEAKLVSDIGANFHRILQLIKNKPTNISKTISEQSEEAAMESMVTVLRRMREDPMFDMDKFLSEVGLTKEDVAKLSQAEAASEDIEFH